MVLVNSLKTSLKTGLTGEVLDSCSKIYEVVWLRVIFAIFLIDLAFHSIRPAGIIFDESHEHPDGLCA